MSLIPRLKSITIDIEAYGVLITCLANSGDHDKPLIWRSLVYTRIDVQIFRNLL